ncbi:MAG: hypothetical protein A2Y40_07805 [Candidatus Margulisbacteria bacterium GWF2_35_9]|nr:MAG: hypothetical protein A2Y40_07805 [Candidatus Margulisbacteria bacterium GWF2_35_9]
MWTALIEKYSFNNVYIYYLIAFIILSLIGFIGYFLTRKWLLVWIENFARKTSLKWDDHLIKHHFFRRIVFLVPAFIFYNFSYILPSISIIIKRLSLSFSVLIITLGLDSLISVLNDIYEAYRGSHRPIKVYLQSFKLFLYGSCIIIMASILMNKSPWVFISSVGAMTAILLLIFKNTLLSFVATIQLGQNNLIQIGDWIQLDKYGADGDVVDISLHTVTVQNWDKTLTSIPTFKLIEEPFINWKGMTESGGRRIKRNLYIDLNSIHICTSDELERYKKFYYLKDYIIKKEAELHEFNKSRQIDMKTTLINGRRMTNIGTFRAYIEAYLADHPSIRKDMTFLIRQLEPCDHGLPIQIYVFTNTTVWSDYERIQADIFDHLLAVTREFNITLFQQPSGNQFTIHSV